MTVSLRNSIPQNLIQIHEEVDGVRSLPLDSYDESTIDKVLSFKNRLLTEVRPLRQLGPLDAHIAHEINSIDRKLAFIFSKARSHVVCMPRTYLDYDRGDTSAASKRGRSSRRCAAIDWNEIF
jgi:hypothetical protein